MVWGWGTQVHRKVNADIGVASISSSGSGGCWFGRVLMWGRIVGWIGPMVRVFRVFIGLFLYLFLCLTSEFLLIGRIGVRRAIWALMRMDTIIISLISLSFTYF